MVLHSMVYDKLPGFLLQCSVLMVKIYLLNIEEAKNFYGAVSMNVSELHVLIVLVKAVIMAEMWALAVMWCFM